ncbi:hypothetical protein [Novosphingobium sp. AAP83]
MKLVEALDDRSSFRRFCGIPIRCRKSRTCLARASR